MHVIRHTEGQRVQVLGDPVTIRVASADPPGGQALVDDTLPMHTPTGKHRLQPGDRPARLLARTVDGPMQRFCVTMAERVHQLPQQLATMQSVRAAFGVQRVGAAP